MKVFSIFKPALFPKPRPREDYFLISKKTPIFVVADGVSLKSDDNRNYPKHSGAGELAKIFCEAVISEAEKRYKNFNEEDLKEVFKVGNEVALKYNISRNRTKNTINYWDFDLFAATTAFLLIKEGKAYWWSLCDSGVAFFGKWGKQLFCSPECWSNMHKYLPANWKEIGAKEKTILRHRLYRNGINKRKELIGYGVVTGEEKAVDYLKTGTLKLDAGNVLMIYTDGFEDFIKLDGFNRIFTSWPDGLKNAVKNMLERKGKEDPVKYGREKTLIAISV